jgi:hypothetical protein
MVHSAADADTGDSSVIKATTIAARKREIMTSPKI